MRLNGLVLLADALRAVRAVARSVLAPAPRETPVQHGSAWWLQIGLYVPTRLRFLALLSVGPGGPKVRQDASWRD